MNPPDKPSKRSEWPTEPPKFVEMAPRATPEAIARVPGGWQARRPFLYHPDSHTVYIGPPARHHSTIFEAFPQLYEATYPETYEGIEMSPYRDPEEGSSYPASVTFFNQPPNYHIIKHISDYTGYPFESDDNAWHLAGSSSFPGIRFVEHAPRATLQQIRDDEAKYGEESWLKRRPFVYDPDTETVIIGAPGTHHGDIWQEKNGPPYAGQGIEWQKVPEDGRPEEHSFVEWHQRPEDADDVLHAISEHTGFPPLEPSEWRLGKQAGVPEYAEHVPIEAIMPYKEYDRRPGASTGGISSTPEYWDALKKHIAEHGFEDPLTLEYEPDTNTARLGEGNHRLLIAQELGLSHVPVHVMKTSTPGDVELQTQRQIEPDQFDYFPSAIRPHELGLPISDEPYVPAPTREPTSWYPTMYPNRYRLTTIQKAAAWDKSEIEMTPVERAYILNPSEELVDEEQQKRIREWRIKAITPNFDQLHGASVFEFASELDVPEVSSERKAEQKPHGHTIARYLGELVKFAHEWKPEYIAKTASPADNWEQMAHDQLLDSISRAGWKLQPEHYNHPMVQMAQRRLDALAQREDTPFDEGKVVPADLREKHDPHPQGQDNSAVYMEGTHTSPVILFDPLAHNPDNLLTHPHTTIDHEVAHAIQDERAMREGQNPAAYRPIEQREREEDEAENWHFADSWVPKDQWPAHNDLVRDNTAHCTCKDGHKLDCPVHGLDAVRPAYEHVWDLSDHVSPAGKDADTPRTWMKAQSGWQSVSRETLPQQLLNWQHYKSYGERRVDPEKRSSIVHKFPDNWTVQAHPDPSMTRAVGMHLRNCWQGVQFTSASKQPHALHDENDLPRAAFNLTNPQLAYGRGPKQLMITEGFGPRNKPITQQERERLQEFADANGYLVDNFGYQGEQNPEPTSMKVQGSADQNLVWVGTGDWQKDHSMYYHPKTNKLYVGDVSDHHHDIQERMQWPRELMHEMYPMYISDSSDSPYAGMLEQMVNNPEHLKAAQNILARNGIEVETAPSDDQWHVAAIEHDITWTPGSWGKWGMDEHGKVTAWNTDVNGVPHHMEVLADQYGTVPEGPDEGFYLAKYPVKRVGEIKPDGTFYDSGEWLTDALPPEEQLLSPSKLGEIASLHPGWKVPANRWHFAAAEHQITWKPGQEGKWALHNNGAVAMWPTDENGLPGHYEVTHHKEVAYYGEVDPEGNLYGSSWWNPADDPETAKEVGLTYDKGAPDQKALEQVAATHPALKITPHSWGFRAKVAKETLPQQVRRWKDLKPHPRGSRSTVVHQYPDGWTVQEHPTKFAVQAVGQMMQNCWQGKAPQLDEQGNLVSMGRPGIDAIQHFMAMHDENDIPRVAFYVNEFPSKVYVKGQGFQPGEYGNGEKKIRSPWGPRNQRISDGEAERLRAYAREHGISDRFQIPEELAPEEPVPATIGEPEAIGAQAKVAADEFDTRQYPDARQLPPTNMLTPAQGRPHPEKPGCTCEEGLKLECPIHGMFAIAPDKDHTWSIPEGHPVGYPQDQPRNYKTAESAQKPIRRVDVNQSGMNQQQGHPYHAVVYSPRLRTLFVGPAGGYHQEVYKAVPELEQDTQPEIDYQHGRGIWMPKTNEIDWMQIADENDAQEIHRLMGTKEALPETWDGMGQKRAARAQVIYDDKWEPPEAWRSSLPVIYHPETHAVYVGPYGANHAELHRSSGLPEDAKLDYGDIFNGRYEHFQGPHGTIVADALKVPWHNSPEGWNFASVRKAFNAIEWFINRTFGPIPSQEELDQMIREEFPTRPKDDPMNSRDEHEFHEDKRPDIAQTGVSAS